ncbi:hypothetical protein [Pseudonocardia alni]|uniref:hypothetical protein n=1 Tax=Pseudonocardia alni TaxID=33907 RepID=UPI003317E076
MSGTWRTVRDGTPVWAPAVLVTSAAQAATTTTTAPAWVAVSFGAAVAGLAVVVAAARAAVVGGPRRPAGAEWLWALVTGLAATGTGLVAAPALAPVLAACLWWLPVPGGPGRAGTGRRLVAAAATVLLVGLAWVVALLCGLFLTGIAGAALTWLAFGLLTVPTVAWWTVLRAGWAGR